MGGGGRGAQLGVAGLWVREGWAKGPQARLGTLAYDLSTSPSRTRIQTLKISKTPDIPPPQVLHLVLRQPTLLLFGQDTLRSKIEALQRILGDASYQAALLLAAKQPSLVGYQSGVLEAKHAALCAAAGLAGGKVRGAGSRQRRGVAALGGAAAARFARFGRAAGAAGAAAWRGSRDASAHCTSTAATLLPPCAR